MKKPEIESMLGGIFVNKNMVKKEHVEEIIDALIKMRSVWWNECWEYKYKGSDKEACEFASNDELFKMMDNALKNIGCKDEL